MDPKTEQELPKQPQPAAPPSAPKKRFQLKRLKIERLEERITPAKSSAEHYGHSIY
jgi:hypothetical protein